MSDLVLLVDDEPNILRALARLLNRRGFETLTAPGATEALELLSGVAALPKVVVSDYRMPRVDGVEFLAKVRQRWPHVQRVLLTGQADAKAVEQAINEAAVDRFLTKPWEEAQLLAVLRSAARQFDLHLEKELVDRVAAERLLELQRLNESLEAKVGERTELLARTKRIWEHTFDVLDDPIALVSDARVVDRANAAFARVRGSDVRKLPGRPCWERLGGNNGPCAGCTLDAAMAGAAVEPVEIAFPDGGRWEHKASQVLDPRTGQPVVVCVMRDVTGERSDSERALRDEKLAAAERMAATVAHQINNPLAVMLANVQYLSRATLGTDETEALRDMEDGVRRAQEVVRGLADLPQRPPPGARTEAGDLDRAAERVAASLEGAIGARQVRLRVALGAAARRATLSDDELLLVLRPLLEVACDASPRGGEVVLETAAGDGEVRIRIKDDGGPLTEAEQKLMFEPYFRTKRGGRPGLGLATAYALVRDHGGAVRVATGAESGVEVLVTLPAPRAGAAEDEGERRSA